MVRDALEGERAVKEKTVEYLPAPPGMNTGRNEVLGSTGKHVEETDYDFYLGFAEFPEIVDPALIGFQGVLHAKAPTVKLLPDMEYLAEDATPDGLTLNDLWQLVTREILAGGRVGLLADISVDDRVRFVPYSAENILNWRARPARKGGGASFVVLREIQEHHPSDRDGVEDEFKVVQKDVWRELRLNDLSSNSEKVVYQTRLWEKAEKDSKEAGEGGLVPITDVEGADADGWVTIQFFGKRIDWIPFLSINAIDISYKYGSIPMLPLARRAYSVYRLTADYRRALYLKGDPQPYVSGIDKKDAPKRTGGAGLWTFIDHRVTAQYLDVDGDGGIPMMADEIKRQLERFDQEGGRLLSVTNRPESGDALKHRLRAHQVTLRNVVINAGAGMQQALRMAAAMMGKNADEVTFRPDLDFSEPGMTSSDAVGWAQARQQGFPISEKTMHDLARRGGVTELTFEEEVDLMTQGGSELDRISLVDEDEDGDNPQSRDGEMTDGDGDGSE